MAHSFRVLGSMESAFTDQHDFRASARPSNPLDRIIGVSRFIQHLKDMLPNISQYDCPILLLGPTGVGKELVAEIIHELSPRKNRPLLKINAANIPDTLFESELFGALRGSYSGAVHDREGLVKEADGGTLFIDEIDALSMSNQAKILRFIETKEFRPLGSSKTHRVDVRIIVASNRNLRKMVRKGKFRDDLYYRIKTLTLKIPPLRRRPEDIPLLILHFLHVFKHQYRKPVGGISPSVWKQLLTYSWPGNVRELRNEIERLIILTPPGKSIQITSLSPEIRRQRSVPPRIGINLRDYLAITERQYIKSILEYTGGNVSRSARLLGISRVGLSQKIRRYKLQPCLKNIRRKVR